MTEGDAAPARPAGHDPNEPSVGSAVAAQPPGSEREAVSRGYAEAEEPAGATSSTHVYKRGVPPERGGFISIQAVEELQSVAWRFWIGVLEALAVNNVWRMLRKSRPLWVSVRNAAIFNIVWMGYGFFHRTVVSRRIWGWLGDPEDAELHARVTGALLLCCWNLPLYLLLLLLSISWYQDTAQRACQLVQRKARHAADPLGAWRQVLESMGDEVYRVLLVLVFWACAKAAQLALAALGAPLLAALGAGLYALACAWMASFYAFEYVWVMIGWTLDERLRSFENRCAYFAGFGAPLTAATFALPFFPATAVYASCFPLLILLAAAAAPKEHRDARRVPLFRVPHRVADAACRNAALLAAVLRVVERALAILRPAARGAAALSAGEGGLDAAPPAYGARRQSGGVDKDEEEEAAQAEVVGAEAAAGNDLEGESGAAGAVL